MTIDLPEDLAPALRGRALALVADLPEPRPHPDVRLLPAPRRHPPVCVFCHRPGKLGGHHLADGSVGWTHKRCHRRHHRAETRSQRALERRGGVRVRFANVAV